MAPSGQLQVFQSLKKVKGGVLSHLFLTGYTVPMAIYQVTIIPFIYCPVAETCLRPYEGAVENHDKVHCVF